jgi:NADH-quinone oxidoreductase subunit E
MAFEVPAELEKRMDEAISHYPVSKRSAVLPLLHLMQHHFRFISDEAVNWVAAKLGLEPIQVLEVVTFYPGFRQTAPGKYHIRVCRTLSCAMAGSYELMESLLQNGQHRPLACGSPSPHRGEPDGKYSIEFAECLASCGFGPVCMVEDDFYEKVDPARRRASCWPNTFEPITKNAA